CNVQVIQTELPPPVCDPTDQNRDSGEEAHFHASGGSGSFSWSASGGSRTSGSGSDFDTTFFGSGTRSVTVTSNGLSDSCFVHLNEEEDNDLSCSASDDKADIDDFVTFR